MLFLIPSLKLLVIHMPFEVKPHRKIHKYISAILKGLLFEMGTDSCYCCCCCFFFCSLWSQTRQKKTHLLPSYVSFSTNFVYRMRSVQLYSHVKIGQFPERCNVNTTLQTCSHGYHYKTVCTTHVSVNDLSVV